MANITKRGNSYRITVSAGSDATGTRIRKYMNYTPTATTPSKIEKEVQAVAAEFEKQFLTGQLFDGENITFRAFTEDHWIPEYAEKNLSPVVIADYKRKLKDRIFPAIGNLKLSKITSLNLNAIYNELSAMGRKPGTIKKYHALHQAIFKYAYKSGIIQENPCPRCTLPKDSEKYKYQIWTPQQVDKFFTALRSSFTVSHQVPARVQLLPNGSECQVPEFEFDTEKSVSSMFIALYTLCIFSSARRGEIAALTWEDIDFDSMEIDINKAATHVDGDQALKAPKTASGRRRVTVPARCLNALKQWKREEMELSLQLGSMWEGYRGREFDKNFVFIQKDSGKMIHTDTITQKFKKIVEDYNATCKHEGDKLPDIRLHDLRHTGASLLIAAGEDIVTVSHRLGHAKPSTTMDIYSHALPLKDKEASDRLDRMISG